MRTVLHLSDLHFGRLAEEVVGPLADAAARLRPDLIAVSGDLTQRARASQFRSARQFLDLLPGPKIVVPGNHDVPLYDLVSRFLMPLRGFRRYVCEDLEPLFQDDEIAVLGVNTARSLTIKGGRINAVQMRRVRELFAAAGPDRTKILVSHHPFELAAGGDGATVGRAAQALAEFAGGTVDLLLAGHDHRAASWVSRNPAVTNAAGMLLVQAGTATSTRTRTDPNSFNLLEVERQRVSVHQFAWNPQTHRFERAARAAFDRVGGRWQAAPV